MIGLPFPAPCRAVGLHLLGRVYFTDPDELSFFLYPHQRSACKSGSGQFPVGGGVEGA